MIAKVNKKMHLPLFICMFFMILIPLGCMKKQQGKQSETKQKIQWINNLDTALILANKEHKPLMIDFMAEWCPPCRQMEDSTFSNSKVIQKSEVFVPLRIDVDKNKDIANKYNANAKKYGGIGIPNVLFMTSEERKIKHIIGFRDPKAFLSVMDSVLIMLE